MLFVSSKVSQLALLPQGRVEAARRAKNMVMAMEELGFGNCTNTRACEAVCPKNETIANIARLNREFIWRLHVSITFFYYYGITKNLVIMKKNERFVITINRELGSGGHTVGRVLAEKLGVPYYDKMLSKALEEKFDLSHRQIEELKGKNRSWWEEIKRVLVLGEGAANSSEYYDEDNNRYVTSEAVLKAEREILQNIASEESCVIAGRSAFFAMNDNPNHLSVLIQASMDHRVKRVMAKQGLTEKEAKKVIKMVDETREEYMKNNAHTSRYDTRNYDLVIRMDGKTEEEAANVILAYIG